MCLRAQDLSGAFAWPTGINVYLHITYPLEEKIFLTELFVEQKKQYLFSNPRCLSP